MLVDSSILLLLFEGTDPPSGLQTGPCIERDEGTPSLKRRVGAYSMIGLWGVRGHQNVP
jgi:hypothetical protein